MNFETPVLMKSTSECGVYNGVQIAPSATARCNSVSDAVGLDFVRNLSNPELKILLYSTAPRHFFMKFVESITCALQLYVPVVRYMCTYIRVPMCTYYMKLHMYIWHHTWDLGTCGTCIHGAL